MIGITHASSRPKSSFGSFAGPFIWKLFDYDTSQGEVSKRRLTNNRRLLHRGKVCCGDASAAAASSNSRGRNGSKY